MARAAVMRKLVWSLRTCFHDGTLAQLSAGGLSSLSWGLSIEDIEVLEYLHDMAAGLPRENNPRETKEENTMSFYDLIWVMTQSNFY